MLGRAVTKFMLDRSLVRAYSSKVPSGTKAVITKPVTDTKQPQGQPQPQKAQPQLQPQKAQPEPLSSSSSSSLKAKQPQPKSKVLERNRVQRGFIDFESMSDANRSTRDTEDFTFYQHKPVVIPVKKEKKWTEYQPPISEFDDLFVPDMPGSFEPIRKTSSVILPKYPTTNQQPPSSSSSFSSSPLISTDGEPKRPWNPRYNTPGQNVPRTASIRDDRKRSASANFLNLIFSSPSKEEIEALLEKEGTDIDVNTKVEKNGENALSVSVRLGNNRVLNFLIDKGVDIDNVSLKGFTPLLTAVFEENTEAIQILLDRGCDYNVHTPKKLTPLFLAIALERPKSIRFLLRDTRDHPSGIIPSSRFATLFSSILPTAFPSFPAGGLLAQLFAAVDQGEIKIFKLLLELGHDHLLGVINQPYGESNLTLLSFTVLKKRHDFLKILTLNKNIFLRATSPPREWTAAHYAASENDVEALKIIFSNTKHINANVQDVHGRTPLYIACMHGAREAADYLLSKNADPLVQAHDGSSPFSISATKLSSINCLSLFSDFDFLDKDGNSVLLLAVRSGSQQIVTELLSKGFNPYFENCFNLNAFALARQHNQPEIASLLVDRFVLDQAYFNYRPFPSHFPTTQRFL